MALTQMQQIQSLGEALGWLEREITWGVEPAKLTHLNGRIGELYACVLTNGQMALKTNQRGYDVVASNGDRVSVKTTTQRTPCSVRFNEATLSHVDRVVVLRINTEEMQVEVLVDESLHDLRPRMRELGREVSLTIPASGSKGEKARAQIVVRMASHNAHKLEELESGTIRLWYYGEEVSPVKPALRRLANELHVNTKNSQGNDLNTRQLGSAILDRLTARSDPRSPLPA